MTHKLIATVGAAATLGLVGAGAATAAGYHGSGQAGSGNRADCPYSTTNTPLRIHAHAHDGTGPNARPGAPLHAQDGTGPHGRWMGGR